MNMPAPFPLPPFPRVRWNVDAISRDATLSTEAPRIPWNKFVSEHFNWVSGEHVALIGPTGQGKTTMLMNILRIPTFVVVFATKPRDKTMDELLSLGYLKISRWQSIPAVEEPRRVLWPDARKLNSAETQKEVFEDAMARIYLEGGWTVAIDELWFFINELKMGQQVKTYLLQARSLGISLVVATQRPAWVPLEIYDQSTHLFFWRDNDETNLRRISGISYKSSSIIREIVANLDQYQVLYINTRTGEMVRTRCPKVV